MRVISKPQGRPVTTGRGDAVKVTVRLSEEEARAYRLAAGDAGLTVAEWMRKSGERALHPIQRVVLTAFVPGDSGETAAMSLDLVPGQTTPVRLDRWAKGATAFAVYVPGDD